MERRRALALTLWPRTWVPPLSRSAQAAKVAADGAGDAMACSMVGARSAAARSRAARPSERRRRMARTTARWAARSTSRSAARPWLAVYRAGRVSCMCDSHSVAASRVARARASCACACGRISSLWCSTPVLLPCLCVTALSCSGGSPGGRSIPSVMLRVGRKVGKAPSSADERGSPVQRGGSGQCTSIWRPACCGVLL